MMSMTGGEILRGCSRRSAMPVEVHYFAFDVGEIETVRKALLADCPEIAPFVVKGRMRGEIGVRREEGAPERAERAFSGRSREYSKHVQFLWSKKELEGAPWFNMWFGSSGAWEDAGLRHGNAPDLSDACPCCGAGWRPADRVITTRRIDGRVRMSTLITGELVVSSEIRESLLSEGIEGAEFLPLISGRKRARDTRTWVLSANNLGIRAGADSWLEILDVYRCPACDRSGWSTPGDRHGKIVYPKAVFGHVSDVFLTWEYFGVGRLSHLRAESTLPRPGTLVSQKVYRVLKKECRIQSATFEPVFLLE
jgi:hypothetical protein